jgi:hypothetical protein
VGDTSDVAGSSADAPKEENENYDTNEDENPLYRKRNEPPKKGSLAHAIKGRSKNRPQGMGNRALREEGIEFGAHSMSHRRLTVLAI